MSNNILDQVYLDPKDVKQALAKGGIKNFFEMENGSIVVQESDEVQVKIKFDAGRAQVKSKFPTIGNSVQILTTLVLFVGSLFLDLPFSWIIAILLGQLLSFVWFNPKITRLKEKVELALLQA